MQSLKKFLIVSILILMISPVLSVQANSFSDVSIHHSNKKEIDYLVNKQIIKGYEDGKFRPERSVTNRQAAVMVARALQLNLNGRPNPHFSDVFSTSSGFKEIAALVDEGILPKENSFFPDRFITREEIARLLVNAFQLKGEHHTIFNDVPKNYWAFSYINKLAANQVTTGYEDGSFAPKKTVSRAHFSAFLARTLSSQFKPKPTVIGTVSWGMNMKQVEKIERSPLIKKHTDSSLSYLVYETSYGSYYAHLTYYFENNRLSNIIYDFIPESNELHTVSEMRAIQQLLTQTISQQLGKYDFINTSYSRGLSTLWQKQHYTAMLSVKDDSLYTTAVLFYSPSTYQMMDVENEFKEIINQSDL